MRRVDTGPANRRRGRRLPRVRRGADGRCRGVCERLPRAARRPLPVSIGDRAWPHPSAAVVAPRRWCTHRGRLREYGPPLPGAQTLPRRGGRPEGLRHAEPGGRDPRPAAVARLSRRSHRRGGEPKRHPPPVSDDRDDGRRYGRPPAHRERKADLRPRAVSTCLRHGHPAGAHEPYRSGTGVGRRLPHRRPGQSRTPRCG